VDVQGWGGDRDNNTESVANEVGTGNTMVGMGTGTGHAWTEGDGDRTCGVRWV